MAADMIPVTIGEMRHRVMFANSQDVIDPTTRRSVKQFTFTTPEYASIRPVGTQQFFDGYQTESAITHTVYTRWRSDANLYQYLVERVLSPDTGTEQELYYIILRATDWVGMRAFVRCDVRLEGKL